MRTMLKMDTNHRLWKNVRIRCSEAKIYITQIGKNFTLRKVWVWNVVIATWPMKERIKTLMYKGTGIQMR